jgi:hypothetical protein
MSDEQKNEGNPNYGIVGNVTAKAVAVGTGATATATENTGNRAGLEAALQELETELQQLNLSRDQLDILSQDVEKLKKVRGKSLESHSSATAIMAAFVAKLKMIGVVAESVISLKDPLLRIASWFGIAPPF